MSRYSWRSVLFSLWLLLLNVLNLDAIRAQQVVKLNPVVIAANETVVNAYHSILNGRECYEVNNIGRVASQRGVTDLLLICQAFYVMGQILEFELLPSPSYRRALAMVEQGRADIAAESIWLSEAEGRDLHVCAPIIRDGEFEKGIYTRLDHPLHNVEVGLAVLSGLRAVTLKGWHTDWLTLTGMTDNIVAASSQLSMHKVIHSGRADFTIAEFTGNQNMTRDLGGYKLYPVSGVKVLLPGSRHFVVSKKSASSAVLLQVLNDGISRLRASGEVRRRYMQAGFFSERVSDWSVVNKP